MSESNVGKLQVPSNTSSYLVSTLVSEDSSVITTTGNFYSAIYEFAQGSYPNTIWEHGTMINTNQENFKLLVVNTPVNSLTSSFSTTPVTVVSSFEGISYIAIYFQLFDIEARGFTRTVIFVLAHANLEILSKIRIKYSNELVEFIKRMQEPSVKSFPGDLLSFAKSLKLIQEKTKESNSFIDSKMNELKYILDEFGIHDVTSEGAEERTVESYTIINNNLRSINELSNFNTIVDEIECFVDSLPTTKLLANILSDINFYESDLSIDFGGTSDFINEEGFSFFTFDIMNMEFVADDSDVTKYSLISFLRNNIFYFLAFSLLSGQTLVIRTENKEIGKVLAKRLTVLCPFFRQRDLVVCDEIEPTQALKYSIVVARKINGEFKNIINLLDIDVGYYTGDGCSPTSFVYGILGKCCCISESAFVLDLLCKLKAAATDFIITLSSSDAILKSPDSLLSSLKETGFTRDDFPLLKYWTHAYFNKDNLKPILMNNKSKAGLTMAPF
jgi:hypothetical protein